jgi:hypothetical protein
MKDLIVIIFFFLRKHMVGIAFPKKFVFEGQGLVGIVMHNAF